MLEITSLCHSWTGPVGKSTLLRIIAGLETPTTGEVFLDGKEVAAPVLIAGWFSRATCVPLENRLGNVELGPKLRGIHKKERRETAAHYINLVGLNALKTITPISSAAA